MHVIHVGSIQGIESIMTSSIDDYSIHVTFTDGVVDIHQSVKDGKYLSHERYTGLTEEELWWLKASYHCEMGIQKYSIFSGDDNQDPEDMQVDPSYKACFVCDRLNILAQAPCMCNATTVVPLLRRSEINPKAPFNQHTAPLRGIADDMDIWEKVFADQRDRRGFSELFIADVFTHIPNYTIDYKDEPGEDGHLVLTIAYNGHRIGEIMPNKPWKENK